MMMMDDESVMSHSGCTSSGDLAAHSVVEADGEQQQQLSSKETRDVRRFRVLVLLVLATFAVTVAVLVYLFSRNVEENEFEKQFLSNGNKVMDAFSEDSYRKMQALFSLSSAITSHALNSNSTWPFVTVPNSAQEFGPYLSLADAAALNVFPIVPKHLRAEWELYSVQNQHWIDEALQATTTQLTTSKTQVEEDTVDSDDSISPFIKNYVGVDTSPGIWTPWWQYCPVIPNRWFVNFNRLAWEGFPQQVSIVQQGKATLSETTTIVPGLDFQSTKDFDFTNQLLQAGGRGRYQPGEPLSYIFYPILDNFSKNGKTVAVLSATVYWKSYFQGILPDEVEGIVCVVSNSAGQAFTYQVNGREAIFLGMEDKHDAAFDDMKMEASYSTILNSASSEAAAGPMQYQGVHVDDKYVSYKLEVYPSKDMRGTYHTNNPIYFALAIGFVFVLCALIFAIFNYLVERRQKLVLTTAQKSSAVVASIFPSNVRDRLLEDAAAATPEQRRPSSAMNEATTFLSGSSTKYPRHRHEDASARGGSLIPSPPIADHFENVTVFFGDIKGFTAWCDGREPVAVFTLLETLYKSFDQIAKRRRVYKVESVGDCYMAVTGLPQKRHDHAIAMVRFSRDVMDKFNRVIHELEEALGEGTNQLSLRVGLHSGPCTAGVIRSQNARFQLSGDTVNTASRMESTGKGGYVQISQSTADLINASGKSNWLTPREDLVEAKGKGCLQTYWLNLSVRGHETVVSEDGRRTSETASSSTSEASLHQIVALQARADSKGDVKEQMFEDEPVDEAAPMTQRQLSVETEVEI